MIYQLIKVLYRIIIEDKQFEKEILVERVPGKDTVVFLNGYNFIVVEEVQNLGAYVENKHKVMPCNIVYLSPELTGKQKVKWLIADLRALQNGSSWEESPCNEIVLVQEVETVYREPTPGEIVGSSRFMSVLVGFILGAIAMAAVFHFLQ